MSVASNCGADGQDVAEMPWSRVCVEAGFEVILVLRNNKKRRVLRFRADSGSLSTQRLEQFRRRHLAGHYKT
jgi:hypothetical protein